MEINEMHVWKSLLIKEFENKKLKCLFSILLFRFILGKMVEEGLRIVQE